MKKVKGKATFRLIFLGAGFSRLAGLPLGSELFSEVRHRAQIEHGVDNHIERDLRRYIEYLRVCDDRTVPAESVDFEEFLAFLDIEHFLGLKGKDTWSSEGNETQLFVRHSIGRILFERTPKVSESFPSPYRLFARSLTPTDWVFTFNYDNLLERVLDAEGIAYRLYPFRYSEVGMLQSTVDNSRDELVVIKLHGSVDWYDRSSYDESVEIATKGPIHYEPKHPIFGPDAVVSPIPLTDGPRPPNDPLTRVFRVPDPRSLHSQPYWKCAPLLLPPSRMKFIYLQPLKEFWWGLQRMGGLNLSLNIVGYSLPLHDEYARQVLYHVAANFTDFEPDYAFKGRKKSMVRILDQRTNQSAVADLRQRYRFINPERCEFWFDGLSEAGVKWLFR